MENLNNNSPEDTKMDMRFLNYIKNSNAPDQVKKDLIDEHGKPSKIFDAMSFIMDYVEKFIDLHIFRIFNVDPIDDLMGAMVDLKPFVEKHVKDFEVKFNEKVLVKAGQDTKDKFEKLIPIQVLSVLYQKRLLESMSSLIYMVKALDINRQAALCSKLYKDFNIDITLNEQYVLVVQKKIEELLNNFDKSLHKCHEDIKLRHQDIILDDFNNGSMSKETMLFVMDIINKSELKTGDKNVQRNI